MRYANKNEKSLDRKHLDIKIGDLILIPCFCGTVCRGDYVGDKGVKLNPLSV